MSTTSGVLTTKAMLTGAITAAANNLLLKEDLKSSIFLGVSVGLGDLLGQYVGASGILPVLIPDSSSGLWSGATVQNRLYEIGGEYAGVYIASNFFKQYGNFNTYQSAPMTTKLGMLILSDVAATYISDFINGAPESYLA